MALEAATYISGLSAANPPGTDQKAQGDDHLRLIKSVLQSTFPNASRAFYFPTTESKSASFAAVITDWNKTFLIDTSSGSVTATMPSLSAADAGWCCFVIKTTTDTNPIFVAPPSGTIQSGSLSGLAYTRRCIPGVQCRIFWTGAAWIAERAHKGNPVGAIIDYDGSSLPVGYELPNGQTLAGTAGSIYPDYYAQKGGLVVRDITGRVVAMLESVATRLTAASAAGIDGATLGDAGGAEEHQITADESATLTYSSVVTDPNHTHTLDSLYKQGSGFSPQAGSNGSGGTQTTTGSSATGITVATTSTNAGDAAHTNVQPTIVLNKILVVE